jgi:uncharacterized membrane protein
MALYTGSFTVDVDAPVEVAFAYTYDHHNVPRYMETVISWEPVGEDHGVGAVYRAVLQGGPKRFTSEVEITERVENQLFHWEPRSGLHNTGTWRFEPHGERTTVTFEQTISPPGGIGGRLLQTVESALRAQTQRSLDALKQQIEARAT